MRRRFLPLTALALVSGVCFLVLASPGAAQPPESDHTATALGPECASPPAPNATPVTVNLSADPSFLLTVDPALASFGDEQFWNNELFLGLMRLEGENSAVIPALATSWVGNGNSTVFTFTLRGDVRWTNGATVTAADVRYGILRSLSPEINAFSEGNNLAYVLYPIANAEGYQSGSVTDPDDVGVTVLDATHLRFDLERPTSFLPAILAVAVARPMPQAAIEAYGTPTWTLPAHIVTSGPYRLAAWTKGISLTLEKNPTYYDAAHVQIERANVVITDVMSAWNLYLEGELDTAVVPDFLWDSVLADPVLAAQAHLDSGGTTQGVFFQTTRWPMSDPLVRRALAAAVDRAGLVQNVVHGPYLPALTMTPPGLWGAVNGAVEGVGIPYSPVQARAWLSQAGFPNGVGFPITVTVIDNGEGAFATQLEFLRQNWWDNLGISVTLIITDRVIWRDMLKAGTKEIGRQGWILDYWDGYNFLHDFFTIQQVIGQTGGWNNPAYEGFLAQIAAESDPQARLPYYKQAERILVETDAVFMPLYYAYRAIAAKPQLDRTYGAGGFGWSIAPWRIGFSVYLPVVLRQ